MSPSFSKSNKHHNIQRGNELRIKQSIEGRVLRKPHISTNFYNIKNGKDLLENKTEGAITRTQQIFFLIS